MCLVCGFSPLVRVFDSRPSRQLAGLLILLGIVTSLGLFLLVPYRFTHFFWCSLVFFFLRSSYRGVIVVCIFFLIVGFSSCACHVRLFFGSLPVCVFEFFAFVGPPCLPGLSRERLRRVVSRLSIFV